jgi:hypothetical protein
MTHPDDAKHPCGAERKFGGWQPRRIASCLSALKLADRHTDYFLREAVCPKCGKLFPAELRGLPRTCNSLLRSGECGTQLWTGPHAHQPASKSELKRWEEHYAGELRIRATRYAPLPDPNEDDGESDEFKDSEDEEDNEEEALSEDEELDDVALQLGLGEGSGGSVGDDSKEVKRSSRKRGASLHDREAVAEAEKRPKRAESTALAPDDDHAGQAVGVQAAERQQGRRPPHRLAHDLAPVSLSLSPDQASGEVDDVPVHDLRPAARWVPRQSAYRVSLGESIKRLFATPGFADAVRHYQDRPKLVRRDEDKTEEVGMQDVFDGSMWRELRTAKVAAGEAAEEEMLGTDCNLGLSLFFDGFQRNKRGVHSVHNLQLVILNLPREERHQLENILLWSVVQGPGGVPDAQQLLGCLVDELLPLAKDGIDVCIPLGDGKIEKKTVRVILVDVRCDLPATAAITGHPYPGRSNCCAR